MGSGDWLKTIISRRKTKPGNPNVKKSDSGHFNGLMQMSQTGENLCCNESCNLKITRGPSSSDENLAATQIQTAFRCYKARKTLHSLKGAERLKALTQQQSVQMQASMTLTYLRSWNKLQSQISTHRHYMMVESRIKHKKQEHQLKHEAKLHDVEATAVEWCGGPETREELLARKQQRVAAAVKRERAMAYSFSHQRANCGMNRSRNFINEFGKAYWNWNWTERRAASSPSESRLAAQLTNPGKVQTKTKNKLSRIASASSAETDACSDKLIAPDGKGPSKGLPISTCVKKLSQR